MKLIIPVFISGLMLFTSCSKEDTSTCNDLVVSNGSFEDRQESISNLSYEDGILSMTITYNKCSVVHDFDLIWEGAFNESLPVQAGLIISDNNDPELCNAIGSDDYCFDIKPILDELESGEQVTLRFYQTDERLTITK